jgi:hypothetical protein
VGAYTFSSAAAVPAGALVGDPAHSLCEAYVARLLLHTPATATATTCAQSKDKDQSKDKSKSAGRADGVFTNNFIDMEQVCSVKSAELNST